MLKYYNFDIVFQEVPSETTLAINLTNCPNCCKGCHSAHLQQDIGTILSIDELKTIIDKYASSITCVCFMGGDIDPAYINELAHFVKLQYANLKVAWYSGKALLSTVIDLANFDYIKIGPYIEKYGGLDKPTTNQRFYAIQSGELIDIGDKFRQKSRL